MTSFATMAMVDTIILTVFGPRSFAAFFQNIVADLLGGNALAFVLAIILIACEYVRQAFWEGSRFVGRLLSGFAAIILGILASTAAFYVFDFFYRPLPVRFDISLGHPSNGTIIAEPTDPQPKKQFDGQIVSRLPFSFAPNVSAGGEINWASPQGPTKVQWSALGTPAKFDAEITLVGGCWDIAGAKAAGQRAAYSLPNVRTLDFWIDGGITDLTIDRPNGSSGDLSVTHQRISTFSTSKNDASKKIELQQFIYGKAMLGFKTSDSEVSYYVTASAFTVNDEAVRNKPTTLHVNVDGRETAIQLKTKAGLMDGKEPVVCRQIGAPIAFSRRSVDMDAIGSLLGILIKVKTRADSGFYVVPTQDLKADGESGWITLKGLEPQALSQTPAMHAEMVAIGSGISSAAVNETAETINDTYDALGDFDGSYDINGRMRFVGVADFLWKNSMRANPTKWESTSSEARGRLIGWAIAALSVLVSVFVVRFRNNIDLKI
ncbi:hypothetical protein HGP13_33225 [Mesorhizobium sp. NZP2077]|uniref:hypothetical protein n=1 Tax=Mesorhizobium sp. NZP2077 TaxID=2483404 RepID=UPI001557B17A|nr:hypothetical protein [Mesorhizobium sp. NZP2077]QKD19451.1 hypothetical protein HGP13_33225 [Mesorhizobium sp. NZP2077]